VDADNLICSAIRDFENFLKILKTGETPKI
jgi:hypothetical protein